MAKKTKTLDKMTYGNSEFVISDLMTSDRWTDGHISNSIDPRTLYARGSMTDTFYVK